MVAIATAQSEDSPQPVVTTSPKSPPHPSSPSSEIHLTEKKVLTSLHGPASFDSTADRDPSRWILDTGASSHMTGARSAFASLDTGVTGSVRFGDGSTACIEGRGTILLSCKNGEHRSLSNVYYLPRLTANIISVG